MAHGRKEADAVVSRGLMLILLLLVMASHAGSVGPSQLPLTSSTDGACEILAGRVLSALQGLEPPWAVLRLRGGGRAWIRKTVKAASKKERQRKKRNIDSTNLRASVKLDPHSVPPGLLLKNELENQAEKWLMGGCRTETLPTVEPLRAIEEARLRLQSLPDKPQRVPRTIKSRQEEEDATMRDDKGGADDQTFEEVGSKGSRAIQKSKGARGMVSAALHKGSARKSAHIKQGSRSSNKGGGMRLRGGAPDNPDDEISSVVSDDTSSVVSSSSSSSFALPTATKPRANSPTASSPVARSALAKEASALVPMDASADMVKVLSAQMCHLNVATSSDKSGTAANTKHRQTEKQQHFKTTSTHALSPHKGSKSSGAQEVEEEGEFEMGSGR